MICTILLLTCSAEGKYQQFLCAVFVNSVRVCNNSMIMPCMLHRNKRVCQVGDGPYCKYQSRKGTLANFSITEQT